MQAGFKEVVVKEEKKYRNLFKRIDNLDISNPDTFDDTLQDYEIGTANQLAVEDCEGNAGADLSLIMQVAAPDNKEALLLSEQDKAYLKRYLKH